MSSNHILITMANAIDPTTGGVERVYHNLTPALREHGYEVYVTYNIKSDYDSHSVYTEIFYLGDLKRHRKAYFKRMFEIIRDKNIDIAICPFPDYYTFRFFSRQSQLKVFFHVHNVPSLLMYQSPRFIPKGLKGTFIDKIAKKTRFLLRYSSSFKRIDKNGMKVVLLSEGFRQDLNSFYHFKPENVVAIPNPFPIKTSIEAHSYQKEKAILYVGRINQRHKRFQSVLNIWQKLQDRLPGYCLNIVGGGQEKEAFEKKARDMKLKRITFYGFQNPDEFYKKSLVSCMTSNFEGFPMVLVEAMQYGCVPFAFDSFAAIHDIIDNGVNGFIIPPFDEDKYAETVERFVHLPPEQQTTMQDNCIKKAQTFSVDKIYERWNEIIRNY